MQQYRALGDFIPAFDEFGVGDVLGAQPRSLAMGTLPLFVAGSDIFRWHAEGLLEKRAAADRRSMSS
jgi:hypothetical protein